MTAAVVHGDPQNYPDRCKCAPCAQAWWRAAEAAEHMCVDCGGQVARNGDRGRWPKRCLTCERAYYERKKDEIAAKKRAYRERKKDEIAAKNRAYYERKKDEILPPPPRCGRCGVRHERRRGPGRYPRLCADCRTMEPVS